MVDDVTSAAAEASEPALAVPAEPASGLVASRFDQAQRWPEIEWDDDGYPVGEDDGFPAFDNVPMNFWQAAQFLLRELPACAAHCCAYCDVTDGSDAYDANRKLKTISFSTGGWSGAESLIGLIESRFDTSHFMLSWRRGGHFEFEIPMHFLAQSPSHE